MHLAGMAFVRRSAATLDSFFFLFSLFTFLLLNAAREHVQLQINWKHRRLHCFSHLFIYQCSSLSLFSLFISLFACAVQSAVPAYVTLDSD